jgi:hypothetical protein
VIRRKRKFEMMSFSAVPAAVDEGRNLAGFETLGRVVGTGNDSGNVGVLGTSEPPRADTWSPYKSRPRLPTTEKGLRNPMASNTTRPSRESLALDTFTVLVFFVCAKEKTVCQLMNASQPRACAQSVLSNEARIDSPGWSGKQVSCIDQRVHVLDASADHDEKDAGVITLRF